jgi:ABC-2 type transport system ATP-binding protein
MNGHRTHTARLRKLVADHSIEHLRSLMELPTLEEVFSQLAVERDSASMARQIADLIHA